MIDGYRFIVDRDEAGTRLDVWLARRVPDRSRSALAELVRRGRVQVGGETVRKAGYRLRAGETVEVAVPDPEPSTLEAEAIPLSVLFEDEDLLVVDKPAGLVVHPAAGHRRGTLVNALLAHGPLAAGEDPRKPGLVHRLDKDTSGCLVVAKSALARTSLERQFRDREVRKIYLAVVHGRAPAAGEIDAAIGRDPRQRRRMSVRARRGREARSRFRRLEHLGAASLLEVQIVTGRTHQVRVHLASIGLPVVGDLLYGGRRPGAPEELRRFPRQALHAAELEFLHPRRPARLCLRAPLPVDLAGLLDELRGSGESAGGGRGRLC